MGKYVFFLKFFERRNVYSFFIKKKVQGKNEVTRNLSAFVIEKFNGFEIIRNNLSRKKRLDFDPIDIVYEPSFDENTPVVCNFTSKIHLACKSYIGRIDKGKKRLSNRIIRQCHYCQNYFAKNEEAIRKHLSICAAKEGITYSFDNSQIINYQDNFKYMGYVPFCVYFDFETTTGDSVFFDSKMYVVSYCQFFSFNPAFNLDSIVIYGSFQQTPKEIYDLSHFKSEHVPFLNQVILRQLKDASFPELSREKCSSLAELFSIELKFTIDTLKDWFNRIIKPKFFELDCIKKQNGEEKIQ